MVYLPHTDRTTEMHPSARSDCLVECMIQWLWSEPIRIEWLWLISSLIRTVGAVFWCGRMAVSWSGEDPMAHIHSNSDWLVLGTVACDRTALMRANHYQMVQKGSRIWFESGILVKHWFGIFESYIASIDEPFIMLDSWWCLDHAERLLERFRRIFMRVLEFLIKRLLYKGWVVNFFIFIWFFFSYSEVCTPRGGRLEADSHYLDLFIFFLSFFFLPLSTSDIWAQQLTQYMSLSPCSLVKHMSLYVEFQYQLIPKKSSVQIHEQDRQILRSPPLILHHHHHHFDPLESALPAYYG